MLLQQHVLNVIYLGVWVHLGAVSAEQPVVCRNTCVQGCSQGRAFTRIWVQSGEEGVEGRGVPVPSLCCSHLGLTGVPAAPWRRDKAQGPHARTKREAARSALSASQPAGQLENTGFQTLSGLKILIVFISIPVGFILVFPKL